MQKPHDAIVRKREKDSCSRGVLLYIRSQKARVRKLRIENQLLNNDLGLLKSLR